MDGCSVDARAELDHMPALQIIFLVDLCEVTCRSVTLKIGLQAYAVFAEATAYNLFHAAIVQVDAGTKFCHGNRQMECVSSGKLKEVSLKRKTAQPRSGKL